jgi:predicted dehydrogenase
MQLEVGRMLADSSSKDKLDSVTEAARLVLLATEKTGPVKALMDALLTASKRLHASELFLEVRADNPVAQGLYLALGFEHIDTRKNYYQPAGVDAWVMRLTLPKGSIGREPVAIEKGEPLKIELESFLNCAREGLKPKVTGLAAADALDIALEITRRIGEADPRNGSLPV